jgi:C2 domain
LFACASTCRAFLSERLKLRTSVQSRTLQPVWNEDLTFIVHSAQHQTLTLQLWDSDTLRPDDKIGDAEVALRTLDLSPGAVNRLELVIDCVTAKYSHKKYTSSPTRPTTPGDHAAPGSSSKAESSTVLDRALRHFKSRPTELTVEMRYFPFSVLEAKQAEEAGRTQQAGDGETSPRLQMSPTMRNVIQGGLLYVRLKRAFDLRAVRGSVTRRL